MLSAGCLAQCLLGKGSPIDPCCCRAGVPANAWPPPAMCALTVASSPRSAAGRWLKDTAYRMAASREPPAWPGAAGLTTDMTQPSSHMLAAGQDGISQSWVATQRHLHCHSPCHPYHCPVEPYLRLQCVRVLACFSLARTVSFSSLFLHCVPSLFKTFEAVIISLFFGT